MCFHVSLTKPRERIVDAGLEPGQLPLFPEYFHVSGFAHPSLPVLVQAPGIAGALQQDDNGPALMSLVWGLVPGWARDPAKALELRRQTLNARMESAWEKPSFRDAWKQRPCAVLVDGFYEPHLRGKDKWAYYLCRKDRGPLWLAGLWEPSHLHPEAELPELPGAVRFSGPPGSTAPQGQGTFTILTTEARGQLREIHNEKLRMPVILSDAMRDWWLGSRGLDQGRRSAPGAAQIPQGPAEQLPAFLGQGQWDQLEAWTVDPRVLKPGWSGGPDSQKPWSPPPTEAWLF